MEAVEEDVRFRIGTSCNSAYVSDKTKETLCNLKHGIAAAYRQAMLDFGPRMPRYEAALTAIEEGIERREHKCAELRRMQQMSWLERDAADFQLDIEADTTKVIALKHDIYVMLGGRVSS
jgi:uncharacterized membrane protein YgaE (UPF0421/DUF939 family)|tara:strand:+ start:331 stop:690 length:360 start_codon:yes stop_codon:yes gene_type:complete